MFRGYAIIIRERHTLVNGYPSPPPQDRKPFLVKSVLHIVHFCWYIGRDRFGPVSYEGFVDSEGFDGGDGQVGVVGDGECALAINLLISPLMLATVYELWFRATISVHRTKLLRVLLPLHVCVLLQCPKSYHMFASASSSPKIAFCCWSSSQGATPWNSLTRKLSPALRTGGLRSRRLPSSRSPSLGRGTPGAAAVL